jgi:hypothetical protein
LDKLFERLKAEVEAQIGQKVYSRLLKSGRVWALYATKGYKGNFADVRKMVKADRLRIAVKEEWTKLASVTPEEVKDKGWFGVDGSARWYVPEGDNAKLKKVSRYLAKVYSVSPAGRFKDG